MASTTSNPYFGFLTVLLLTAPFLLLSLGTVVPVAEAGPLDYNMMNCFDFARHMGGTVPSRFGVFGADAAAGAGAAGAAGAAASAAAAGAAGAVVAKRQLSSLLPSSMTDVFSTVSNLGNQNVANCQSAERHAACVSIDQFLESNFPGWFFEYQVTNNVNHVVSQMTQHRYHALFEAAMKAYKCFCVC